MNDAPSIAWNEHGLVPAIVQDAERGTVLMMAWMNVQAWQLTRDTGIAHFWSRSRNSLWKKGETSGNTLEIVEIRVDCDADTVLLRVRPAGPACHTGTTSCFFDVRVPHQHADNGVPATDAASPNVLTDLEATMIARRDGSTAERSYTRSLLDGGMNKILGKIAEESGELAAELPSGSAGRVVSETADLLFHVMVGLVARTIAIADVWLELSRRAGVSGHVEKAARPPKST